MTIQQALQLAVQHQQASQLQEAEALYQQILAHEPNHAPALHLYGLLMHRMGKNAEAVELIRRSIAVDPSVPDCRNNLAVVLGAQGLSDEAIAEYRRAVGLRPDYAEAHYNLAMSLLTSLRLEDAAASFQKVIELQPSNAEAHFNLGNALGRTAGWKPAIEAYERALKLAPHHSDAQWNLALLLLLTGDFKRGWPLYESRWAKSKIPKHRGFHQPLWDGSDLQGRRILLLPEQGMGDIIQFIRFAPLVAARGGTVIFQSPPALRRLLEGQCEIHELVTLGDRLPPFDVHYPLLSLPGLLGTMMGTIPASAPYLFADNGEVERWREKTGDGSNSPRVGLVWAGRPTHPFDRERSLSLAALAPLSRVANVRFFSLQKGEAASQALHPPAEMHLVDWTDQLSDFADTAALIANLDLVIACDTSVAHLAGAMGKPVWVLLPYAPDWRWMLDRDDSPWYPTARLYRQKCVGDWSEPVAKLAADLSLWAAERSSRA